MRACLRLGRHVIQTSIGRLVVAQTARHILPLAVGPFCAHRWCALVPPRHGEGVRECEQEWGSHHIAVAQCMYRGRPSGWHAALYMQHIVCPAGLALPGTTLIRLMCCIPRRHTTSFFPSKSRLLSLSPPHLSTALHHRFIVHSILILPPLITARPVQTSPLLLPPAAASRLTPHTPAHSSQDASPRDRSVPFYTSTEHPIPRYLIYDEPRNKERLLLQIPPSEDII